MEIQRIKEKNSLHTFKDGIGKTEDNPIFATSQSRMRIGMHLKACWFGLWHSPKPFLSCSTPYIRNSDIGGRHFDREYRQDDGAFLYCQYANLRSNHRPKDFKGYGQADGENVR